MWRNGLILFLLSFLFKAEVGSAQTTFSIQLKVVDSLTQEPLQGATVVAQKHRHAHITDEKGRVLIDSLSGQQVFLHVTYVGYHHADLVVPLPQLYGDVFVPLCPENFHLHEAVIAAHSNSDFLKHAAKDLLHSEEIQNKSGQTLGDLLNGVNGVSSLNSSGGISKPVIRGLSGQRLSVYAGTTRLEGQQWGADHGPEVDILSVEQVEVVKGAATLEFGPEAIGGMIRLEPKPWRKNAGIDGAMNMQAHSNNQQGAFALQLNGARGDEHAGLAFRSSFGMRKAGDSRTPDYVQSNTGFEEASGQIGLEVHKGKWWGEANYSRYQNKAGIFASSHLGNSNDLEKALQSDRPLIILPFTYSIQRPFQFAEHELVNVSLNYKMNNETGLRLNLSQQVNRRREYDADLVYNRALLNSAATDLELLTRQADLLFDKRLAFHLKMRVGYSLQTQENSNAGLQTLVPDYTNVSQGAFILIRRELFRGSISGGIRFDRRSLSVPVFKFQGLKYSDEVVFQGFSAGVNGVINLKEDLQFQFMGSTGFRPPAPNERYSYGLHFGLASFETGDPGLGVERSHQVELGLIRKRQNWEMEVNTYLHYFTNFIYRRPMPNPVLTVRGAFPGFVFSACDALMAGGEISLLREPEKGLLVGMQASYLYAQNQTLNEPLLFMPSNRMSGSLGYRFKNIRQLVRPQLRLLLHGIAQQNRFPSGVDYLNPPAAYWLAEIQFGSEIHLFSMKPWKFSFGIRNLFQQRYRDYLSRFRYFTDEPGRNIYLQLKIPF